MNPGTIVRCRNRDWVLLPSENEDFYALRPLAGTADEVTLVHRELSNLIGYSLPEERVRPSSFPPPTHYDLSDAVSSYLLWQAARLTLREGATPFRSLGRISIRPRVYQFVPLLMALRLDPVRLFIADDVGVGKTIEALLIARELWDRGEIKRIAVLCPPYLCDQWQKELTEKFNLEAVVIRSGTISQLERGVLHGRSIYQHYPIQVISIDWVKTERNKHQFLQFCPEFVIVDEVHGAAEASERNKSQQQRHQLLREISQDENRHLVLLTATPHSGIEEAFRSLLGLLKPEFRKWEIGDFTEPQRIELARHFVQRTRKDIEHDWEGEHCFPERQSSDESYQLSEAYRQLFEKTYEFCSEIVATGETLVERKRRVRYWGVLALMRCIMSSPQAAIAALETRHGQLVEGEDEIDFRGFIFESSDEATVDEQPTPPIEATEQTLPETDKRKLRELGRLASELYKDGQDNKLLKSIQIVKDLLKEGFNPIVWCRYVATAEYVTQGLRHELPENVQIVSITGRLGDEERRLKIEEVSTDQPRVLVATDCLSEGVNLQEKFDAVIHYDLPWNPNRLEQREGRVDRYGQTKKRVKAIRFFGRDNPVDGIVIDVLLNKAREIHQRLGTYVPVPEESESVTEAVLNALFLRGRKIASAQQLAFEFANPQIKDLHHKWERDAEREHINRTRFAQRAIKPDEVKKELEATDTVLGDPQAVREFFLNASQRLCLHIVKDRKNPEIFRVNLSQEAISLLPDPVRLALPIQNPLSSRRQPPKEWLISFVSPTPEGAEYIGRNHRFVSTLARFLLEEALTKQAKATATRCGALRTSTVNELTRIMLLRVRYLLEQPERSPLLSEEVLVLAYRKDDLGKSLFLEDSEALRLLSEAKPDANIPMEEKQELVKMVLNEWAQLNSAIREKIDQRARELEASHKRIRRAVSLRIRELKVKPQLPPDLFGLLVLQPLVK